MAALNALALDGADKEKVTPRSGLIARWRLKEHSGEATECSDDTFVSAGSTIEVTLLNGDVLHSETLSMGMHLSRLRKDTLEACALIMNIPRAAADLVFSAL